MEFRNEWKHQISYADLLVLRQRLRAVMQVDAHSSADGTYAVRSLYFDTPTDKALREKIDGVNCREKFRIRYYNGDTGWIHVEAILDGQISWMPHSGRALLIELYSKMHAQGLRPKTIVDYTREPFVYGPGNVRVTLDYDIRTGLGSTDFLNPHCVTIPADAPLILMEVKWDAFLPSVIRSIIQLEGRRSGAFSKYRACRIYG